MELNPGNALNKGSAASPKKDSDTSYQDKQLKEACEQFESIFLTQILSGMDKSGFKPDEKSVFGNSQEEEMWKGMLNQQRAEIWAKQGGVGLASLLYNQLKDRI